MLHSKRTALSSFPLVVTAVQKQEDFSTVWRRSHVAGRHFDADTYLVFIVEPCKNGQIFSPRYIHEEQSRG